MSPMPNTQPIAAAVTPAIPAAVRLDDPIVSAAVLLVREHRAGRNIGGPLAALIDAIDAAGHMHSPDIDRRVVRPDGSVLTIEFCTCGAFRHVQGPGLTSRWSEIP